MSQPHLIYFKQPIIPSRYTSIPPLFATCLQPLQSYMRKPDIYLSPDPKRPPTFIKNTNRKYFGGAPTAPIPDMKKSSILLNYLPRQDTTRLLGSKSPCIKRPEPIENAPVMAQSYMEKRENLGGMYSSVIVPKSEEQKKPSGSGLAAGDKIKELHDWADQLKKKLTPFLDQENKIKKSKEDLVNKYSPPPVTQPAASISPTKQEHSSNNTGVSAFSKNKKNYEVDYSKDFTDYSKFSGLLRQNKNQPESASTATQLAYTRTNSYTLPAPVNNAYVSYPQIAKKPEYNNDYTSSLYSTSSSYSPTNSSYSPYSSYNSNSFFPQKQEERKPLKKEDFEIGKKLGNGMFGEVFLVRHKTLGFVCALKILKKSLVREQKVENQLVRQIKIQFYLQHQNVINLYGFFYDAECVYLLQELCMDGHLFSMLKQKTRFQDVEAADIIRQICVGLDYIHRERIIHRDIKPQNIIMHMGVAKICDFGWAVYRGDGLRSTFCGTPLYTPPELLRGENYDQKFDIWAIGILAYELIIGRFPFKIFCEDDLNRILTDQITFPFSVEVSPDAKNFILSIIRKDPRDRIEIDEILFHPFLRKNHKTPLTIDFKL